MVVDVLCILEIGGPRGPAVPPVARFDLRLPQGSDCTIRLLLIRSDGTAYDLRDGSTMTLAIRKFLRQTPAYVKKVATPDPLRAANAADVVLVPADTKDLVWGHYVAEAWLTRPGGAKDPVLLPSAIFLEPTSADAA